MDSGRLFFDPTEDPLFRGPRSMFNMEEIFKKRPFFSSSDDLYDQEYYDDQQLPEKKRRLTAEQVHLLEKSFEIENKLEPERKTQLAKNLGLQPRQVAVWFQNRRARWKTKQLERDYDQFKSSYESLILNYESIRKDNEKLKAEVMSLNEKLQVKEVAGEPISGEKPDLPAVDTAADVPPLHFNDVKVEDRLSTGSDGSAVVDHDDGPQLVDSGDSYFPDDNYKGCVAPIDGVQSEDDDGSDDGRSYFSSVLVAAEQQRHDEGEPLGWWVWS